MPLSRDPKTGSSDDPRPVTGGSAGSTVNDRYRAYHRLRSKFNGDNSGAGDAARMTQDRDARDLARNAFANVTLGRASLTSQSQLSIRSRATSVARVRLRIRRSWSQEIDVENLPGRTAVHARASGSADFLPRWIQGSSRRHVSKPARER